MSFATFMLDVPPWLRLLLAIGITVAMSVLFVHLFHPHMVRLTAPPAKTGDDSEAAQPPSVKDLSGRLIALATFAFVFLLGFGFGQFWDTAKDAREAVLSEATDYRRAVSLAENLPPSQGDPIVSALETYRAGIVNVEWSLMENADADALAQARFDSGALLLKAILDNPPASGEVSPVWSNLTSSVDDLLSDAVDRTNALPSPMAVSIIVLVFVLGLTNLIAIAVFQPAPKKANLVVVATMAALTGFLLFVLVEISNPYTGAGAISSRLLDT